MNENNFRGRYLAAMQLLLKQGNSFCEKDSDQYENLKKDFQEIIANTVEAEPEYNYRVVSMSEINKMQYQIAKISSKLHDLENYSATDRAVANEANSQARANRDAISRVERCYFHIQENIENLSPANIVEHQKSLEENQRDSEAMYNYIKQEFERLEQHMRVYSGEDDDEPFN